MDLQIYGLGSTILPIKDPLFYNFNCSRGMSIKAFKPSQDGSWKVKNFSYTVSGPGHGANSYLQHEKRVFGFLRLAFHHLMCSWFSFDAKFHLNFRREKKPDQRNLRDTSLGIRCSGASPLAPKTYHCEVLRNLLSYDVILLMHNTRSQQPLRAKTSLTPFGQLTFGRWTIVHGTYISVLATSVGSMCSRLVAVWEMKEVPALTIDDTNVLKAEESDRTSSVELGG